MSTETLAYIAFVASVIAGLMVIHRELRSRRTDLGELQHRQSQRPPEAQIYRPEAEIEEHVMRLDDTCNRIRFNGPGSFEEIASLEVIDGKLVFTGNADAAARMFFENYLQRECDTYIKRRLAEHGIQEVPA